ncbi:alpha/beta hydrolase family protein [Nocardia asteroides]|uniref:alpha/beta hydrolase family protein n=1 Tax=Nocardia asteroides TaxID=1824 RepID=UPI0022B82312|nr:chlorophyllase [Nocardia asteroides]
MLAVETTPVVSVDPVLLPAPGRGAALRVRVSAPAHGAALPIILFAHGFGSSGRAYGPLADHWAAAGFAVLQPTFRDSRTLGPIPDDPLLWRYRVEDMLRILDNLEPIAAAVPGLAGRLDPARIAAAGHSFGGQTAGILLGLRVLDPVTGEGADLADERVRAGVLLATAGRGGADLNPAAAAKFPWLNPDFTHLTTPTLVVAGDADSSPLSTRGPEWLTDPYHLSPGARALLTLRGAEHSLGGIPGYDAAETTDADPARVRAIQTLGTAFLRNALYPGDPEWDRARTAFADPALGALAIK